jgi:hypothetical protein
MSIGTNASFYQLTQRSRPVPNVHFDDLTQRSEGTNKAHKTILKHPKGDAACQLVALQNNNRI